MRLFYLFTTNQRTFDPKQINAAQTKIKETYPHCDVMLDHYEFNGSLVIASQEPTPATLITFAIGVNIGRILQSYNIT